MKETNQTETHAEQIKAALSKGWQVASQADTGTQLTKPKRPRIFSILLGVAGLACLPLAPLAGVALLVVAGLNHALTKPQTLFIPRPEVSPESHAPIESTL